MSIVNLSRFGLNLSGRALGISTFPLIIKEYKTPYELDFDGVNSIGSSFADEVVVKLAELNGGEIVIRNSKSVINKCLNDVAKEYKIKLVME
jgi:hypothetical protein